jgi:mannose-6-phosphate isomerase-like protein (cupin superfamily)
MRAVLLFLLLTAISSQLLAQSTRVRSIKPDSNSYENIYVKKISEDSLHSTYIIWVKKSVKAHYHVNHTELIQVVSGKGMMTVGDSTFRIKKGDYFVIPMGTSHSVVTYSRKPLKVISIQSPKFDGDRIWID